MKPKDKSLHKPLLLRLSDIFMMLLTIVSVGSMLMVMFGTLISPAVWSFPSFVILGAPFVFICNVIVLIYWVIRWSYIWMGITAVFMLFWVWDIGAFVQMRFWTYRNTDMSHEIKILTYNVHSFKHYYNKGQSSIDQILEFIRSQDPDIICFQEMSSNRHYEISSRLLEWPYFVNMEGEQIGQGMFDCVVFSKYPLSKEPTIVLENTTGGALPVDIYIEQDTVRLYNCHLQTTDFNNVNKSQSLTEVLSKDDNEQAIKVTTRAMSSNFGARSHQADTLATEIAISPYPVIVVGDFNSVPLSYTYRTVKASLGDAFRSAGEGYGYTYRPMRELLRIDYVLYDEQKYKCIQYNSPDIQLSDHNPVIVTLKRKK